jgi:hypothetical protein
MGLDGTQTPLSVWRKDKSLTSNEIRTPDLRIIKRQKVKLMPRKKKRVVNHKYNNTIKTIMQ